MKVGKVEYNESIQLNDGHWKKFGIEIIVNDDEDAQLGWDMAVGEVEKAKQKHMQINSGSVSESLKWEQGTKIINIEHERWEILIDNCNSIEELAAHKPTLPADLLPNYMAKLKELTKKIN